LSYNNHHLAINNVFQRVSSSYSNTSSWLIMKIKTGFKLYCCVLYYFRYCKDVPASPPFFMFLCLPGHVIDFSFWVFCPLYRKFIMRTIELPQCCSCTKYTCLIQPRIIKIRNYYHWRLFIYPKLSLFLCSDLWVIVCPFICFTFFSRVSNISRKMSQLLCTLTHYLWFLTATI
jgi:hypothetical protein